MTIPGYYHIQGRPADGYMYIYYLNNGRPFNSSYTSYFRRYVVETSVCQAVSQTYQSGMVFLRRARGPQSHMLTYMLTLLCVLIVVLFSFSIFGGM